MTGPTGIRPRVGLSPNRPQAEAGIRMEPATAGKWRESGKLSQLLNPGRSMDPDASRVSGIYDQDLVGQPSFEDVSGELLALSEDALLVAHNAEFDASFLGMELYIQSVYHPSALSSGLRNPWLCTLKLARRNFHFGSNSLGHIASVLGVRMGRAHRALGDVYTTSEVFKRMVSAQARLGTDLVGDLLHLQGGPVYTPRFKMVDLPHPLDLALREGEQLEILYRGPIGERRYRINPQYATEFQGKKYLISYCDDRRDQRTFRVDRISEAKIV